jgi:hypothetical protein
MTRIIREGVPTFLTKTLLNFNAARANIGWIEYKLDEVDSKLLSKHLHEADKAAPIENNLD